MKDAVLRRSSAALALASVVTCLCAGSLCAGNIYYASPTGSAEGDGSEANPYDLLTALNKRVLNQFDEVRLLEGTYTLTGDITCYHQQKVVGWGRSEDVVLDANGGSFKIDLRYEGIVANLTLENCKMSSDSCVNAQSQCTVSNCVFRNCAGTRVVTLDGTSSIYDSKFYDNSGTANGAAVAASGGDVVGCTFVGNHSDQNGGAVAFSGAGRFEDNVLSNNTAQASGGGLYVSQTGFRMARCTIVSNRTENSGGGLYLYQGGRHVIVDSTISCNASFGYGNYATGGGGLYCTASGVQLAMTNCWVTDNFSALNGGGIMLRNSHGVELVKTHLDRNHADHHPGVANNGDTGAALWLLDVQANTTNTYVECTFNGNSVGQGTDAKWAVILDTAAYRTVSHCQFINNEANASQSLFYFANRSIVDHCLVASNRHTNSGGAIFGGSLEGLSDTKVFDNSGRALGFSLANLSGRTNLCVRCDFVNNRWGDVETNVSGAATVSCGAGATVFEDCTFRTNILYNGYASGSGGIGICFSSSSAAYIGIDRCSFVGNTNSCYTGGTGGAIYFSCSKLEPGSHIRNCLFEGNGSGWHANRFGPSIGIAADPTGLVIENCTFARHTLTKSPVQLASGVTAPTNPWIYNCAFIDNASAESTTYMDHCWQGKFADAGVADDLIPVRGSPLVDQGRNDTSWMFGATDLRNKGKFPRIINDIVDIGCYEYRPAPGLLLLLK